MTPERQPGKKWTVFIGVIATFTLLILLVVSVWLPNQRAEEKRARAEIQERLDAIRAAGEPVNAQDLAKLFPDPPPEHDASNVLASAFAALSIPDSTGDLPYFGLTNFLIHMGPLDERARTNLEAILNNNQAALDAVPWDQITNAWIGSGFGNGFTNSANSSVHPLSQFTKLLCLSAVDQAERGHGTEAARQLSRDLALARVLRSTTLMHHLVRRAGEQRVCDGLERVINRVEFTDEDLMMLEHTLADNHPDGLREARMSYRCGEIWGMEQFRTAAEGIVSQDPSNSNWVATAKAKFVGALLGVSGRTYKNSDYLEMLDLRARQIAALSLPPKERFAELQRVKESLESKKGRRTIAAMMLLNEESSLDIARHDADELARLQVAGTALAIERWRLSHEQRLPESLNELVPDYLPSVPKDSFDEQPLRYRKLARGYRVYSIGSDLKDDGGKEKPAGVSSFEGYDITFTIEH